QFLAHRDLHSFPTRRSSDLPESGIVSTDYYNYGFETFTTRPEEMTTMPNPKRRGTSLALRLVAAFAVALLLVTAVLTFYAASTTDRKSTRLNSSHSQISYAV